MSNTEPTNRQLALAVAERALGSREAALELLLEDGIDAVGAEAIQAERTRLKHQQDAKTRAEHEASPAGRLERARQIAAANEEKKQRALLASELIVSEGIARPEELESLTSDEILELAGMKEAPAPDPNAYVPPPKTEQDVEVQRFKERFWTLAEHQRREEAERLGIDVEQIRAEKLANPDNIF
jgi:hypothetical protein